MSETSIHVAGILLITVTAVEFGGARLLSFIWRRTPGYLDNPVRQNLWRAGHAHAGVLVILAILGMLLVDQADLSDSMRTLVRIMLIVPPILMPLGFFLSVASPTAQRPNRLLTLVPIGAVCLAVGAVTLGIGLVSV